MKIIKILWVVIENLIATGIYLGMLNVASTPFELVVVAGLGLIFISITSYSTDILRTQVESILYRTEQLHRLIRIINEHEDIEDDTSELKAARDLVKSKNTEYYINVGFNFLFWLISVIAILKALQG
jgi:hypothetical protein